MPMWSPAIAKAERQMDQVSWLLVLININSQDTWYISHSALATAGDHMGV